MVSKVIAPRAETCTVGPASVARDPISRVRPTGGPFEFKSSSSSWQQCERVQLFPQMKWLVGAPAKSADAPNTPSLLRATDTLNVSTWNIDFSSSFAKQRVINAIRHLQERLAQPPYSLSKGSVILLQEVSDPPRPKAGFCRDTSNDALAAILADEWVQREFLIADVYVPNNYGTVTLFSKNIAMAVASLDLVGSGEVTAQPRGCFRAPAPGSIMGRDVLGVDLLLEDGGVLRICNVHLESLSMGTKIRPVQLAFVSKLLREKSVSAGIVAGDMNAIETPDLTLPDQENVQLRDVWVEYTGKEAALTADSQNIGRQPRAVRHEGPPTWGGEQGHTWGYHEKTIFYPRRLDKVLFCNNDHNKLGVEPVKGGNVDRLGINLMAKIDAEEDPEEKFDNSEDEPEECLPVSDHFGLITRFVVVTSEDKPE